MIKANFKENKHFKPKMELFQKKKKPKMTVWKHEQPTP